jgi:hypothetical protein
MATLNFRTLEESLVRALRASEHFSASPRVEVFSPVEYTLNKMADALASVTCGALVRAEGFTGANLNVPGAMGVATWTVRVVLNPAHSMSANMHPVDVALAAWNTLHLQAPRDTEGAVMGSGQWRCGDIKTEYGEGRNGAIVDTAVFTVSTKISTARTTR